MCRNHLIFLFVYTVALFHILCYKENKLNVTIRKENIASILHWTEEEKNNESKSFLNPEKN